MNINRPISLVMLVSAFGLSLAQPAQAQGALDILRNYIGGGGSTNVNNQAQTQTMVNLNSQRAQIEANIATGMNTGRISAQQAADFRTQLSANSSLQTQFVADGNFTFQEAQNVLSALNTIDSSVQAANNIGAGFYPNNGTGVWRRGSWRGAGDLTAIEARISAKLQRGQANGRLTAGEFNSLQADLNRIAAQRARITNQLNKLDNKVEKNLRDREIGYRNGYRWR